MKRFTIALMLLCGLCAGVAQAQTAEEIIANYFENTGGIEAWEALENIKMKASVNQMGMEIPLEIVETKGGMQYTLINFQGNQMFQGVFDGETLWSTNFQTMSPEKADAESTANQKLDANDFPDPFLHYEDKGYTVELMGTETVEGVETFKVKLVQEPMMIDGNEVENVQYYFFDSEYFVPIMMETEVKQGPQAGVIMQVTFSDYQEVEGSGVIMPYELSQGIKDQGSQAITITSIEGNAEVDMSLFKYPEDK